MAQEKHAVREDVLKRQYLNRDVILLEECEFE